MLKTSLTRRRFRQVEGPGPAAGPVVPRGRVLVQHRAVSDVAVLHGGVRVHHDVRAQVRFRADARARPEPNPRAGDGAGREKRKRAENRTRADHRTRADDGVRAEHAVRADDGPPFRARPSNPVVALRARGVVALRETSLDVVVSYLR